MKSITLLTLLFLFSLFGVSNSYAAIESTGQTSIKRLISYNQYGGGDVVFTVNEPSSNCDGYWIAKSDAGFDANLSMILAAYHSKSKVRIYGHDEQKWNGSTSFWCKLYAIEHTE